MHFQTCTELFAASVGINDPAGTVTASSYRSQSAPEPSGLARRAFSNLLSMQHLNAQQLPFKYRRLDTYSVTNGWQLEAGPYASMLPRGSATATLERFYNEVVERAKFP